MFIGNQELVNISVLAWTNYYIENSSSQTTIAGCKVDWLLIRIKFVYNQTLKWRQLHSWKSKEFLWWGYSVIVSTKNNKKSRNRSVYHPYYSSRQFSTGTRRITNKINSWKYWSTWCIYMSLEKKDPHFKEASFLEEENLTKKPENSMSGFFSD